MVALVLINYEHLTHSCHSYNITSPHNITTFGTMYHLIQHADYAHGCNHNHSYQCKITQTNSTSQTAYFCLSNSFGNVNLFSDDLAKAAHITGGGKLSSISDSMDAP